VAKLPENAVINDNAIDLPGARMADEDVKKLLWMFRHQSPEAVPGKINVDPVDAIYHLKKNTRNPYLQRTIAPQTPQRTKSGAELEKLAQMISGRVGYEFSPSNQEAPHLRRDLSHPPPPPGVRGEYLDAEKLSGDAYKLPWLIHEFFESNLGRLRENPANFDEVVEELVALFHENSIRIRLYEAYYSFQDWNHLMETLEEIAQYPSPETFDLFCSALLTYYELVYPPEGE
jgi:hypothetical protein